MPDPQGWLARWKRPLIGGLISLLPSALSFALRLIEHPGWWARALILLSIGGPGPSALLWVLLHAVAPDLRLYGSVMFNLLFWFALGLALANRLHKNSHAVLAWLLIYAAFSLIVLFGLGGGFS